MAKDPAFLFYPADFMIGTALFTQEQRGKYVTLLCYQHQLGHLSKGDMVGVCGAEDEKIFSKFEIDERGLYYNQRLEDEKNKRLVFTKSRLKNLNPNMGTHMGSHMGSHMENENENRNVVKSKKQLNNKAKFVPPTLQEVKDFFKQRGTNLDPVAFHAHYEANGWVQGRNKPVKNWKACVVTWEQRKKEFAPSATIHGKPPAEVVAIHCVAQKMSDQEIKAHMLEKGYTEHRIVEAIMKARGKVQ